jgi:hypothetical protein
MAHEVVGSGQGETRMPEHIGLSPAEEGWTVTNDNETCLVVALNCNVLQHTLLARSDMRTPTCCTAHRQPYSISNVFSLPKVEQSGLARSAVIKQHRGSVHIHGRDSAPCQVCMPSLWHTAMTHRKATSERRVAGYALSNAATAQFGGTCMRSHNACGDRKRVKAAKAGCQIGMGRFCSGQTCALVSTMAQRHVQPTSLALLRA